MDPIRIEKKLDFDLDSLLAPIPGKLPAGEFLESEETYERINEARRKALSNEAEPDGAVWSDVARLCLDALQSRTKDLQIAGWLTEAWLYRYGLGGLAHGLEVIADLCEYYWGPLHPGAEGGGQGEASFDHRLTVIGWLNENLSAAVRATEREQLQSDELLGVLESATDNVAELEGVLNEHCGERAPRLGELTAALDSIHKQIASPLPAEPEQVSVVSAEETIPSTPEILPSAPGPIRSRNHAYARLADAADFLARTDPHSPVPYLIRRAIAWGNMPLGDLVADLVRNDGDRSGINRLLGVGKPEK